MDQTICYFYRFAVRVAFRPRLDACRGTQDMGKPLEIFPSTIISVA